MHNMDIDVYDIQNTINIGNTYATINLLQVKICNGKLYSHSFK